LCGGSTPRLRGPVPPRSVISALTVIPAAAEIMIRATVPISPAMPAGHGKVRVTDAHMSKTIHLIILSRCAMMRGRSGEFPPPSNELLYRFLLLRCFGLGAFPLFAFLTAVIVIRAAIKFITADIRGSTPPLRGSGTIASLILFSQMPKSII